MTQKRRKKLQPPQGQGRKRLSKLRRGKAVTSHTQSTGFTVRHSCRLELAGSALVLIFQVGSSEAASGQAESGEVEAGVDRDVTVPLGDTRVGEKP